MTVKNHSNDALIVSLVTSSLDGTALPGEQHLAGSLLDRWREGEFETTADETAQAALDDQAVGLDVAPIIEAWLTAITPAPQTRSGPELRAGFEKDLTRIIDEWEERREVCLADPEAKARFLILRSFELVTAAEEGR